MGQFAAAIRGMAAACEALDFPVVSGNVSLYNETEGRARHPADAGDRRPRRAGRCGAGGRHSRWRPGSTSCWSAPPRAGSASRSGCARSPAGRRARRRRSICAAERATAISCAAQILDRQCPRLPRRVGRRAAGRGGGDGDGRADAASGCSPARARFPAMPSGSARTRAAICWPCRTPASLIRAAEAAGLPAVRIGTSGGQDLTLPDGGTISVACVARGARTLLPVLDGRHRLNRGGTTAWRWRRARSRR